MGYFRGGFRLDEIVGEVRIVVDPMLEGRVSDPRVEVRVLARVTRSEGVEDDLLPLLNPYPVLRSLGGQVLLQARRVLVHLG